MTSLMRVPPGSRSMTTDRPFFLRKATALRICVLFPLPSAPSNVMKYPFFTF
jgi:hypothetical protein